MMYICNEMMPIVIAIHASRCDSFSVPMLAYGGDDQKIHLLVEQNNKVGGNIDPNSTNNCFPNDCLCSI